jgi:hypothetical protein
MLTCRIWNVSAFKISNAIIRCRGTRAAGPAACGTLPTRPDGARAINKPGDLKNARAEMYSPKRMTTLIDFATKQRRKIGGVADFSRLYRARSHQMVQNLAEMGEFPPMPGPMGMARHQARSR